jgi:putative transposase
LALGDPDPLREMVGFAAQRLMELEIESLTGAAHGERSRSKATGPTCGSMRPM